MYVVYVRHGISYEIEPSIIMRDGGGVWSGNPQVSGLETVWPGLCRSPDESAGWEGKSEQTSCRRCRKWRDGETQVKEPPSEKGKVGGCFRILRSLVAVGKAARRKILWRGETAKRDAVTHAASHADDNLLSRSFLALIRLRSVLDAAQ